MANPWHQPRGGRIHNGGPPRMMPSPPPPPAGGRGGGGGGGGMHSPPFHGGGPGPGPRPAGRGGPSPPMPRPPYHGTVWTAGNPPPPPPPHPPRGYAILYPMSSPPPGHFPRGGPGPPTSMHSPPPPPLLYHSTSPPTPPHPPTHMSMGGGRGSPRMPMMHPMPSPPPHHPPHPPPPRPPPPPPPSHTHPHPHTHGPPFPLPPSSLPTFMGRTAWEAGLGELLKVETSAKTLSMSKYGVSVMVPKAAAAATTATTTTTITSTPQSNGKASPVVEGEEKKEEEKEEEEEWSDDPKLALDLGVITIAGQDHTAEEETEAFLPKGYEGAPPVIMSVQQQVFTEEEGEDDAAIAEELNGLTFGPPPSRVTRPLRVRNEAPGPYLLREVLILPRDDKESTLWVEVEVGGWTYSSKSGQGPVPVRGAVLGGTRHSPSSSVYENFISPGITEANVIISAAQDSDYSQVKKWIMLRLEGPGVGPAHDLHTHSFVVARKMVATVVDETAMSLLSAEARPFVPKSLQEYFDLPCPTYYWFPPKPPPFVPKGVANFLGALSSYAQTLMMLKNLKGLAQAAINSGGLSGSGNGGNGHGQMNGGGGGGGNGGAALALSDELYKSLELVPHPRSIKELCQNMKVMLQLEEAQAAEDIRRYDLFSVPIVYRDRPVDKPDAPLVTTIIVPGASEKRPPLAYGDEVRLRPAVPNTNSGLVVKRGGEIIKNALMEVRAAVLETKETMVKLLLPPTFPTDAYPSETRFHIRFTYDRFGYRFLHRALERFSVMEDNFLFPPGGDATFDKLVSDPDAIHPAQTLETLATKESIQWINSLINEEQQQAVLDVVNGAHAPLPYILFGPPGTGKTLTVIETILQVCRLFPDSKILAVAPSDVAADIIAERLAAHLPPTQLLRLNWFQRLVSSMKPSLLKYSIWDAQSSLFSLPTAPDNPRSIFTRQVIVSTCATSGLLSLMQRPGETISFTHIFVDESSQALQPEVLVPLSLTGPHTCVVLAGDPKQLGASTRNPLVQQLGLAKSLQEHLMETRAVYDVHAAAVASTDPGSKRYITKLVKNYRSHQAIIEVPSRLFYDRSLEQHGDETLINSMLTWEMLPGSSSSAAAFAVGAAGRNKGGFPILFYGVCGEHQHELDSPSFFNVVECAKIVDLINALLTSKKVHVTMSDIAIISAFRKQVLKLRTLLREKGYGAINVGQVEDFQGQESKVCIISTVLSARHPNEIQEQLGFLGHPKRFNVAVTRSQALTIIVGNPFALWEDTQGWRQLLEFCADHGAVRGHSGPLGLPDVEGVESLLDTIANETLLGKASAGDIFPTALEDYFNDSPWRLLL